MTYDPRLPEDRQNWNDPGNDEPEVLLDEDGEPVVESDEDFDLTNTSFDDRI